MNERQQAVRAQLLALAEEEYQRFTAGLLPGVSGIIGVRLPSLQKLARQLLPGGLYKAPKDPLYEENMLEGLAIGAARLPLPARLAEAAAFVPKIDNWAVCDSFCAGLKLSPAEREETWAFLRPFLLGGECSARGGECSARGGECSVRNGEFSVRFAVVMLLNYYVEAEWLPAVLATLDDVTHPGYYAKIAVSWAVSVCFAKFPAETREFLLSCHLSPDTYAKALQKIRDSRRVSPEDKARLPAPR